MSSLAETFYESWIYNGLLFDASLQHIFVLQIQIQNDYCNKQFELIMFPIMEIQNDVSNSIGKSYR